MVSSNDAVNSASAPSPFDWTLLSSDALQAQYALCLPVGYSTMDTFAVLTLVRGALHDPYSAVAAYTTQTVTAFTERDEACARHFCLALASCCAQAQLRSRLQGSAALWSMRDLSAPTVAATLERCSTFVRGLLPFQEMLVVCHDAAQVRLPAPGA